MYQLGLKFIDALITSFIIYQCVMMNEANIGLYHSLLWGFVYLLTRCLQAVIPKVNQWLVGIILLSGTMQAVVSVLQYMGIWTSNHPLYAATGTFDNPGPLGGYMAVCLVLAVSLWGECNKPIFKRMLIASVLLMETSCVLSDSRAAWMATIVAFGFMLVKRFPVKTRKKTWMVLPVLVIGVAAALYAYRPASTDGRLLVWKVSTRMMADSPLWGQGTNSFANWYMNCQGDYFHAGDYTVAEALLASDNTLAFNEVVRIGCEYGIIGLMLCLGIGVALILASRQADKVQRAAFSALIAYSVFACFSYPAEVPTLKLTGAILLAMAVPCSERSWFTGKKTRLAFLLLLAVYLGALGREHYREHLVKKALVRYNVEEDEESKQALKELYPHYRDNDRMMSLHAKMLFEKGLYEECIPLLTESVRLIPTGGKYMDLGTSYQYMGETEKATACFKRASYMLPGHILPVYSLFCIYKEDTPMPDSATWYAHRLTEMKIKKETDYTRSIRKEAADFLKEKK
ncbi:MAG: O-antigen ligase family protein [Bacteroidaceae bacterium]|nr:O-antigen ligase family protein [Bacteroidaceae bacterium]